MAQKFYDGTLKVERLRD